MTERVADEEAVGRPAGFSRAALLDVCAALLALVGLCDAIYLTVEHLNGSTLQCTITHGCAEVLGSRYATVAGLPLAAFGAAAYFTAFSLATLAAFGYAAARKLLAALVALMFLFSLWLLYLQAFVLHAFCQYCLLSASVTTLLAVVVLAQRFAARRGRRED
ncbi:MAG TPA: vitamin K epoxide reductase family protein [Pyrinomonadaceae bacterium]|nr:vitamin K epoxide reductase family protein [Pyrinomonadaceae bacterium]